LSHRAHAAAVALILVLAAAVGGCGGDDGGGGSEDPNQVLEQTFDNPTAITSGQLAISVDGSAEGTQSGDLTATIEGPFQRDQNDRTALPQVDLSADVSASGAGQSFDFQGGLVATQDNAYVEYQDQAYEVGSALFEQFKRAYEQSARQASQNDQDASSILDQLGIDPRGWFTNLTNEGDEEVDGQDTIHIHGDANVDQIAADFQKVAERAAGGTAQVTPSQLDQLKSAIEDAGVDVYSGKDDHILRKLSVSLSITPPASAQAEVSSVTVNFSITFSDVNEPQEITAPADAKPITDLLSQFGIGSLGPLGSLDGGGSVGGGGGPSAAYLDCIENNPSDPAKCVSEL
jgi:hypothetical protein